MSMFNMMMGVNPFAGLLLAVLGFENPTEEIPRLRDCFIEGEEIVVFTRTGGGNRDEYISENAELEVRDGFLRTEDWDLDSTYAKWFYQIPAEHRELILQLADLGARCDITKKFNDLLNDMGSSNPNPRTREALERARPLVEKIVEVLGKA